MDPSTVQAIEEEVLFRKQKVAEERKNAFVRRVEERLRGDDVSPVERKNLESLLNRASFTKSDKELLKLPTFTQWFIDEIEKRANEVKIHLKNTAMYLACITESDSIVYSLAKMNEETGWYSSFTQEFEVLQTRWWMMYRRITILRGFMCDHFGLAQPDPETLMPDRLNFGTVMSEEDFAMFASRTAHKAGMSILKGENPNDYSVNKEEDSKLRDMLKKEVEPVVEDDEKLKIIDKVIEDEELVTSFLPRCTTPVNEWTSGRISPP